jgi:hypothetical protein
LADTAAGAMFGSVESFWLWRRTDEKFAQEVNAAEAELIKLRRILS